MIILSLFVLLDGVAFLLLAGGIERNAILRVTGSSWEQIMSSTPGIANYITGMTSIVGLTLVGFSFMMLATSVTGYRKGEKWAWLLSWYLPVYFLIAGIITYWVGANISVEEYTTVVLFVFFAISLIAQIGSMRWFFRKSESTGKDTI